MANTNEKYILIVGGFASGKTSVVNAMLGEEVGPAGPLPTTNIITEIRYGDNKIIVYPREGENICGHGDKPFVVPVSKYREFFEDVTIPVTVPTSGFLKFTDVLKQRTTTDEEMPDPKEKYVFSSIGKIEIYVKSEFLKDGIVLVDTPGWVDISENDIQKYAHKSELIIYAMSSAMVYSGNDKGRLDLLNRCGIRNIIFGCTFLDLIQSQGDYTVKEMKEYCIANLLKHTDMGTEAVHFLSAREGLHARLGKNDKLWQETGFAYFSDCIRKMLKLKNNINLKNERNDEKMDKLSKHSKTMTKFKELIGKEKDCAKKIDEKQDQWIRRLDAAIERTNEDFYVVVMGNFSAGKSTMINALIGEDVLPSYPMPTTAVMTELRYGENKKIIMYPKKGENIDGHGDKPFSVPATKEAIEQYITIDNDAGINVKPEDSVEIASKFEKMELYWPLEMLKNGVVVVDSPGLNDPYSNDVIVREYLPKADAIIYTLNSTNPYQGTDKAELDSLNQYGINNIIFACTYWDMIASMGEMKAGKTRTYCISNAMKHTELGSDAVHFLASRDGLHARLENDNDLLVESGYAEFEAFLQDYLTTRRGQDKVKNIVATIETQADQIKKHAAILDENAKKDKLIISQSIESAKDKLEGLKKDAKIILNTFSLKLENKRPAIEATVKHGIRDLKDKVDLEGFTPTTEFRSGWGKLNPFGKNEIAENIAKEFQNEYTARLSKELRKHQSTTVANEMMEAVSYAAKSVEDDIKILSKKLDDIDISVGLPDVNNEQSGHGGNLLLGLAYGLITQDWWTGGTIAAYGGAGRQIGFQLAAGAGLGVAFLMGAPITVPVYLLTVLGTTILGILSENNEKKVEKIRKSTLAALQKAYFDDGDDNFVTPTAKSIMDKADEIFAKACDDVKDVIATTFEEKEKGFKAILDQANLDSENKEQLIKERKAAVSELSGIVADAKKLQAEY